MKDAARNSRRELKARMRSTLRSPALRTATRTTNAAPSIGRDLGTRARRPLRRAARVAVWALPGYAVAFGIAALDGRAGSTAALVGSPAGRLACGLGVLGLTAVAILLVLGSGPGAPATGWPTAGTGVLAAAAGLAVVLPLIVPSPVPVGAGLLHTVGWLVLGLLVLRTGLVSRADGVLLLVAAPLVGVAGGLLAALRPVGALLLTAAAIGLAGAVGRRRPAPYRRSPWGGRIA